MTPAFLQRALSALRREIFDSLHVAMPGILRTWDGDRCTAEIQPALMRKTASGKLLPAPLLRDVPVFLPSPDFIPAPGTPCLLIFADFCTEGFLQTGRAVLPPSPRSHDLSDAFAIVGYRKEAEP